MSDDLTQPDYRSTETGPTTGGLVPDKDEEIRRLTALVEDLRRVYTDPPPDVQEAVIKKLNLVSGEGHELLRQRAEQAERELAQAQAARAEFVKAVHNLIVSCRAASHHIIPNVSVGVCEYEALCDLAEQPSPGALLLAKVEKLEAALKDIDSHATAWWTNRAPADNYGMNAEWVAKRARAALEVPHE